MSKSKLSPQDELKLMSYLWSPEVKNNPEAFIMAVFPWGEPGTPLANIQGPRKWQLKLLRIIKKHIDENQLRIDQGLMPRILKLAICSGRGIGKTALLAWLVLWMLSTRIGSTTVVSANTELQMLTRTWPEVGKWHSMAINEHWFDKQSLSLKPTQWFTEALKNQLKVDAGYYYGKALTWAEENPDAFVGAHNALGECVIFDEASGIPKPMWSATEGFFTEPIADRFWFVFSNGRRNTGEFYECFHRNRDHWIHESIDSRQVEGVDVEHLQSIIERYGDDSDEAAIEVKGEFPKQGDSQFIPRSLIMSAVERELEDKNSPLIMGIDPARKGKDKTVIRWRQGRNGKVIPPTKLTKCDNMQVVDEIIRLAKKYKPDAIACDVGQGTGIIDRLRQLHYKVHEVAFGSKADDERFADRRTEMYHKLKDWLYYGSIDNDTDLISDLAAPELGNDRRTDRPRLQSKEDLRALGHPSPDNADALAVTFDVKAMTREFREYRMTRARTLPTTMDYDVHSGGIQTPRQHDELIRMKYGMR